MSLYEIIADRMHRFRERESLSQEDLAKKIGVAPNTISRWETCTYRPTLDDLQKLARALHVSILEFFPEDQLPAEQSVNALLRTANGLHKADLQELRNYADYLRAKRVLKEAKSPKLRRGAGEP